MEYYLFLDDERFPHNVKWMHMPVYPWIVVRNFNEFKSTIEEKGIPKFISFDHDLADQHYQAMLKECNGEKNVDYGTEKTGYDCAKWLVDYCLEHTYKIPDFQVHSLNPIGKENIETYLNNSAKYVYTLNRT